MNITVRAIYEGGVLRPTQPLPLKEGTSVELTVGAPLSSTASADAEVVERSKACKSYQEWLGVVNSLPTDDGGYDILKALDDNRRWSGEPSLLPDEDSCP